MRASARQHAATLLSVLAPHSHSAPVSALPAHRSAQGPLSFAHTSKMSFPRDSLCRFSGFSEDTIREVLEVCNARGIPHLGALRRDGPEPGTWPQWVSASPDARRLLALARASDGRPTPPTSPPPWYKSPDGSCAARHARTRHHLAHPSSAPTPSTGKAAQLRCR